MPGRRGLPTGDQEGAGFIGNLEAAPSHFLITSSSSAKNPESTHKTQQQDGTHKPWKRPWGRDICFSTLCLTRKTCIIMHRKLFTQFFKAILLQLSVNSGFLLQAVCTLTRTTAFHMQVNIILLDNIVLMFVTCGLKASVKASVDRCPETLQTHSAVQ